MSNSRDNTGVRMFSSLYNLQHGGAPTPIFLWDPSAIAPAPNGSSHTGNFRAAQPTDFSASISVSGLNVATSPNQGVFYSGGSSASMPVQVTNTAPIPVSGVVISQAPNLTAISGVVQVAPNPLQAISGNVTVLNPGTSSSVITGVVSISGGVNVTGTVLTSIVNPVVAVSGNTNATIVGTPTVIISNPTTTVAISNPQTFVGITGQPTVVAILSGNNPIFVTGSFATSSNGSTSITGQTVQLSVSALLTGTNSVSISNIPHVIFDNTTLNVSLTGTSVGSNSSSTYLTGQNGNNFVTIGFTGGNLIGISGNLISSAGPFQNIQFTGGGVPFPVTGNLSVAASPIQATSGFSTVNNTAPIPTSGVVLIANTQPLNVSGLFFVTGSLGLQGVSVTGFSTPLVTVPSGTGFSLITNPVYIVGISGVTNVTGLINIAQPIQPLPISGVVQTSAPNLTAISGFTTILNPALNVTGNFNVTGTLGITSVGITGVTNSTVQYTGGGVAFPVSGNFNLTGSLAINNVSVTGTVLTSGISTTFGFNITGFTVGQVQVPANASAYSIALISGTGFVNNVLLSTPISLGGGGYTSTYRLASAINVGTSGGQFLVTWEI